MKRQIASNILLFFLVFPQLSYSTELHSIYPPKGAVWVHPGDPVLLQSESGCDQPPTIEVYCGANHWPGRVFTPNGGDVWSFIPDTPYPAGADMRVVAMVGDQRLDYTFSVAPKSIPVQKVNESNPVASMSNRPISQTDPSDQPSPASIAHCEADLPPDFPTFQFKKTGDVEPGYYYMVAFYGYNPAIHYAMVIDDTGTVVFYRRLYGSQDENFAPFDDDGLIVRTSFADRTYRVFDSTMTLQYSLSAINSFPDFHDVRIRPNGNLVVLASETREVDLLALGGAEDALVRGTVIQELTTQGDLVKEWRSLDYQDQLPISDAIAAVAFTSEPVDYIHSNSIDIDTDGNLILSHRNLSEVNKIYWDGDHFGDVIWRLGGKSPTIRILTAEDRPISAQHDARRLPNGDLMIFDNGSYSKPRYGRVVAYTINEAESTAVVAWQKDEGELYQSSSRGSCQLLPGSGYVASWGSGPRYNPNGFEWDAAGNLVATITFSVVDGNTVSTYRIRKSRMLPKPAAPELMALASGDTVALYFCKFNDPLVAGYRILLTDPNGQLQSMDVHSATSLVLTDLGIDGEWTATTVALGQDGEILGDTSMVRTFDCAINSLADQTIQVPTSPLFVDVWPNPFNGATRFTFTLAASDRIVWTLYDVLGRTVSSSMPIHLAPGQHEFPINLANSSSGVYFLRVVSQKQTVCVRKIVLLR